MADCDVLICGLGPVGQLLALLLDDLGARGRPQCERALRPAARGRRGRRGHAHLPGRRRGPGGHASRAGRAGGEPRRSQGADDGGVPLRRSELGHPPLVSIHQPSFERAMVAALERRGVDLRWERRLDSLDRRGRDVSAWVRPSAAGPPPSCARATSSVATGPAAPCAPGWASRSAGRRSLSAGSSWTARSTGRSRAPHPISSAIRRGRPSVCRCRPAGTAGVDDPPGRGRAALAPGRIRELMEPWITDEQVEVERAVVYTFHARRAERWRAGRVLLAGDAAHTMPPFVGQGFSSGRATRGTWRGSSTRFCAAHRSGCWTATRSSDAARDEDAELPHPLGRGGADAAARLARLRDSAIGGLESTGVLDWLQSRAKPLPTAAGAFANRPHPFPPNRTVGALFPQPVIDGVRLDDRLQWMGRWASPRASVRLRAAGLTVLDVPDDAWLRRHSLDFALLRPDRYVFACGTAAEAGAAAAAARRLVGDGCEAPRLPRARRWRCDRAARRDGHDRAARRR